MKLILCLTALTGLQLAMAQNVSDCTDIAAGLDTTPIVPITGECKKKKCYLRMTLYNNHYVDCVKACKKRSRACKHYILFKMFVVNVSTLKVMPIQWWIYCMLGAPIELYSYSKLEKAMCQK